ncbi:hypothetical protein K502DRAFT_147324 [Neoconidiobolus thromboides FSU 785]|nr:hypothetical protein K502DRAFT_147324 [Neoconidiobolus thromboides FSU 785]
MSITQFLESKRLVAYNETYFNYSLIDEALNNLYTIEREKAYGFNFTIKHPSETGDKYEVIPAISNQSFKDEYQSFLNLLQCELNRVDSCLQYLIDRIKVDLNNLKQEYVTTNSSYYFTFNQFWTATVNNWFGEEESRFDESKGTIKQKIKSIEKQLRIIKDDLIPLNKFALSKILKKKANLVEKSHYSHLLLEVETGIELEPPVSLFPIMGKNNRWNFSSDSIECDHKIGCFKSFPNCQIQKPSLNELLNKNRNFLSKSIQNPTQDLFHSSPLSLGSSSSSFSDSSISSTFSNDDIVRNSSFWHFLPKQVGMLLLEIKTIKKSFCCTETRNRLIRDVPY